MNAVVLSPCLVRAAALMLLLLLLLPKGDPVKDIVQPAVQGTRTVLEAAARHKGAGLRRVVVTSSVCGGCATGCCVKGTGCTRGTSRRQPPTQSDLPQFSALGMGMCVA